MKKLTVLVAPKLKVEKYKFDNPYDIYVMKFNGYSKTDSFNSIFSSIINTAIAFDAKLVEFKLCETHEKYEEWVNEIDDQIETFNILNDSEIEVKLITGLYV